MNIKRNIKEEAKIIKLPGAFLLFVLDRTTEERGSGLSKDVLSVNDLSEILSNLGFSRYVERDDMDEDISQFKDVGFIETFRNLSFKGTGKNAIFLLITEEGRKMTSDMRLYDEKRDGKIGPKENYITEEQIENAIKDARKIH